MYNIVMDVDVAMLRQKLADFIKSASEGETVFITRYGKRIAKICPCVVQDEAVQDLKDVQHLSDKAQKFQELKVELEDRFKPSGEISGPDPELQSCELWVGACDICHYGVKELWEHEEEGVERNVCRNCFAVRMPEKTPAQFEAFLRTRGKVARDSIEPRGVKFTPLHSEATFINFNPIPKPVKKSKNAKR